MRVARLTACHTLKPTRILKLILSLGEGDVRGDGVQHACL